MDVLTKAGIIRPLISPERALSRVLPHFGRRD